VDRIVAFPATFQLYAILEQAQDLPQEFKRLGVKRYTFEVMVE